MITLVKDSDEVVLMLVDSEQVIMMVNGIEQVIMMVNDDDNDKEDFWLWAGKMIVIQQL